MQRYLFIGLILLLPLYGKAQAISWGTYYYNSNEASSSPITISMPGTEVDLDLTLNVPASLPDGFNTVYFRFGDSDGRESFVYSRIFFKNSIEDIVGPVAYLEYFVDHDPGRGAGVPVSIPVPSTNLMIDFTADLAGLGEGFHWLYVRARDALGHWSIINRRVFYVQTPTGNGSSLGRIAAIKYFFQRQGFTSELITRNFDPPQNSIEFDFFADVSALSLGQTYELHLFAVNEDGVESEVEIRNFSCCEAGTFSCDTNVDLIESSLIDGTYVLGKNITSNGMIQAPGVVLFEAGESISLEPGFKAAAGSSFTGRIVPCNPGNEALVTPHFVVPSERNIELAVFPNPLSSKASVRCYLEKPSDVQFSLVGFSSGRRTFLGRHSFQAGNNEWSIDLSSYPPGVYYLVGQSTGAFVSYKLVVAR